MCEGAAGLADIGATTATTPQGRFRNESITKTFAAVVILKLVEERVLCCR